MFAEEEGEMALAIEAALPAYLADGQGGFCEKAADTFHGDAPNLIHDGTSYRAFEMLLGIAAG